MSGAVILSELRMTGGHRQERTGMGVLERGGGTAIYPRILGRRRWPVGIRSGEQAYAAHRRCCSRVFVLRFIQESERWDDTEQGRTAEEKSGGGGGSLEMLM